MKPITVIVPSYNHEKYVEECLKAIGSQTFRDFQWIVVDDCSKDNTPEILKKYQCVYGYELILHDKNVGLANTLNEVLKNYAKGIFFSICASDDVWLPNKLEAQYTFLCNHPEFDMCYSRCYYINDASERVGVDNNLKYRSGNIFKDVLCRKYQPGIFTMMKINTIKGVGYYKPGIIAEDYYMNCLITHDYEVGFLDEIVGFYRVAPMEMKRNPMTLVLSHRETVDLFKNESIYQEAVICWELYSSQLLARYTKFKGFAFKMLLKNLFRLNSPEKRNVAFNICLHMFLNWSSVC